VSQTIADLAVADANLSTLVAALTAADLVGAISADGPITCLGKIMLNNDTVLRRCPCPRTSLTQVSFSRTSFLYTAPTNDAFAALPEGTVDSLLLPENVETLKDILLTHCISGNILSSMVTSGPITTLSGNTIEAVVNDDGGSITFDGATVITADVVASNGIAHVIDKVIVPTSDEAAATTVAPTTAAPTTEAAKDDTHDDGDDIDHSMDGVKDSPPSSAAMYGTAVATAAVSAGFAMLI